MFHHYVNDLHPEDRFRFVMVEHIMELLLREKYFGEPRTCHIITRAVAPLIRARVVSGSFITFFRGEDGETKICDNEHSWIALRRGWVLDLKPVGIVSRSPILIQIKEFGPGYVWYERSPRQDWPKDIRMVKTGRSVRRMRTALANLLLAEPFSESDYLSRFATLL